MTRQDVHREIRRARAGDVTGTSALIAAAFHELDVSAWLVPDPGERIQALTGDFRIFVEHALTHGAIHLLEDDAGELSAAAVWFPQVTGPTPPPADYDARLVAACGPATPRFQVLDQRFEETHPDTFPHHFLALCATRPGLQGRGLGTVLLDYHHRHLDHLGTPAFLHASCARSRDLYLRLGYECVGNPFRLPDGPPMWPMWRDPRGSNEPPARE